MKKQTKGSKIRQNKAMKKSASSWNGAEQLLKLLARAEINTVSTPINSEAALEIMSYKFEI